MTETLAQALQLTVLGMGMTFASIGALALGMLAMTYLTRGRKREDVAGLKPGTEPQTGGEMSEVTSLVATATVAGTATATAAAAAAAAVAVALAERESGAAQAAAAAVAVSLTELREASAVPLLPANEAWNGFVRSAHLSSRARYESRRSR